VAENDEVIFSICHIWPRDVIDDVARVKAVPRQSFVIHPNGGWCQSTFEPDEPLLQLRSSLV
jgi:hypothetical protein